MKDAICFYLAVLLTLIFIILYTQHVSLLANRAAQSYSKALFKEEE